MHNAKLHNLCFSLIVTGVMKWRRFRWTGSVQSTSHGRDEKFIKILVEKSERKGLLRNVM